MPNSEKVENRNTLGFKNKTKPTRDKSSNRTLEFGLFIPEHAFKEKLNYKRDGFEKWEAEFKGF